jgi:hypothetical protein
MTSQRKPDACRTLAAGDGPTVPRRRCQSSSHDALEARAAPEPVESPIECLVEPTRAADARLQVERLHDQRSVAALRLQIGAPNDSIAPEERQDVVAVAALRRRPTASARSSSLPRADAHGRTRRRCRRRHRTPTAPRPSPAPLPWRPRPCARRAHATRAGGWRASADPTRAGAARRALDRRRRRASRPAPAHRRRRGTPPLSRSAPRRAQASPSDEARRADTSLPPPEPA